MPPRSTKQLLEKKNNEGVLIASLKASGQPFSQYPDIIANQVSSIIEQRLDKFDDFELCRHVAHSYRWRGPICNVENENEIKFSTDPFIYIKDILDVQEEPVKFRSHEHGNASTILEQFDCALKNLLDTMNEIESDDYSTDSSESESGIWKEFGSQTTTSEEQHQSDSGISNEPESQTTASEVDIQHQSESEISKETGSQTTASEVDIQHQSESGTSKESASQTSEESVGIPQPSETAVLVEPGSQATKETVDIVQQSQRAISAESDSQITASTSNIEIPGSSSELLKGSPSESEILKAPGSQTTTSEVDIQHQTQSEISKESASQTSEESVGIPRPSETAVLVEPGSQAIKETVDIVQQSLPAISTESDSQIAASSSKIETPGSSSELSKEASSEAHVFAKPSSPKSKSLSGPFQKGKGSKKDVAKKSKHTSKRESRIPSGDRTGGDSSKPRRSARQISKSDSKDEGDES